ncbi:hypothetical protein LINPERHAP1_LOCUS36693, partial [Linum perenne]
MKGSQWGARMSGTFLDRGSHLEGVAPCGSFQFLRRRWGGRRRSNSFPFGFSHPE